MNSYQGKMEVREFCDSGSGILRRRSEKSAASSDAFTIIRISSQFAHPKNNCRLPQASSSVALSRTTNSQSFLLLLHTSFYKRRQIIKFVLYAPSRHLSGSIKKLRNLIFRQLNFLTKLLLPVRVNSTARTFEKFF